LLRTALKDRASLLDRPLVARITIGLILFSVFCISIETLPNIPENVRGVLEAVDVFVVMMFTCEYIYRVYCSPSRLKFIFSFHGLVDLIAIIPFYLSLAFDARALRLLRILRLLQILKLGRYNTAMSRLIKAFARSREELVISLIAILILLYLAAFGIFHFEHAAQPDKYRSIFDALWWAIATITTVGYGDIYPITFGGRLFTFAVLVFGIGLLAVPTAIISSALLGSKRAAGDNGGEASSQERGQ
jgi:voltage-gated potassium channel